MVKGKRYNILFSSTRQWNPGDEFILLGILNLLKELNLKFNPILFNRHPDIRPYLNFLNPLRNIESLCINEEYSTLHFNKKDILESILRIGFWDNSFKDNMPLNFIDYVIFAGTPEWKGWRLFDLYRKLLSYKGKILFIGIGLGGKQKWSNLLLIYKQILKKSILVTVRDINTFNLLKPIRPKILPCPSIFISSSTKDIREVKKIGLVFMHYKAVPMQRISFSAYKNLIKLYDKLLRNFKEKYEFEFICHYIDELYFFNNEKVFRNYPVYYSYNATDYISIYRKFDLIITPRVHGAALATSLGIPSITLAHDKRADTAKLFLSTVVSILSPNISQIFNEMVLQAPNRNYVLKKFKNRVKDKYLEILSKIFY